MRCYVLIRYEDKSGGSGTGQVAEAVEFEDGTVALHWDKATNKLGVSSTVIYSSMEDAIKVHGHDGASELRLVGRKWI